MLEQNYPNPYTSSIQTGFKLNRAGNITLTIYDLSGRKIQTPVNEFQSGGKYKVNWDASRFSNGLYFYQLRDDNGFVDVRKMMRTR